MSSLKVKLDAVDKAIALTTKQLNNLYDLKARLLYGGHEAVDKEAEVGKLSFNVGMLKQLKADYDCALAAGKFTFIHQGNELVTGYAKFMIEYLETKVKRV